MLSAGHVYSVGAFARHDICSAFATVVPCCDIGKSTKGLVVGPIMGLFITSWYFNTLLRVRCVDKAPSFKVAYPSIADQFTSSPVQEHSARSSKPSKSIHRQ